jgi:hypothetical protein
VSNERVGASPWFSNNFQDGMLIARAQTPGLFEFLLRTHKEGNFASSAILSGREIA